jgi:hypothetical protein
MKLAFSLLGFALSTSMAHAESVYTCTEARGDSVIIEMSRQGENMLLRSLYHKLNFTQSKRHPKKSDYFAYNSARGSLSLQESVVRGDGGPDVVGKLKMEGHVYPCKVGEGKLTVSRATRRESSGGSGWPGNCRVRDHYQGITYWPPVAVCNGGGIVTMIRLGHGGLPF